MVLEVSFPRSNGPIAQGSLAREAHHGRNAWWNKTAHLMRRKEKEE
jgi:hypothetical protein